MKLMSKIGKVAKNILGRVAVLGGAAGMIGGLYGGIKVGIAAATLTGPLFPLNIAIGLVAGSAVLAATTFAVQSILPPIISYTMPEYKDYFENSRLTTEEIREKYVVKKTKEQTKNIDKDSKKEQVVHKKKEKLNDRLYNDIVGGGESKEVVTVRKRDNINTLNNVLKSHQNINDRKPKNATKQISQQLTKTSEKTKQQPSKTNLDDFLK